MGKNKTHNSLTILIFALILALPSCLCMYEDEIGLADWYDAPHAKFLILIYHTYQLHSY